MGRRISPSSLQRMRSRVTVSVDLAAGGDTPSVYEDLCVRTWPRCYPLNRYNNPTWEARPGKETEGQERGGAEPIGPASLRCLESWGRREDSLNFSPVRPPIPSPCSRATALGKERWLPVMTRVRASRTVAFFFESSFLNVLGSRYNNYTYCTHLYRKAHTRNESHHHPSAQRSHS